jgi:tripartite ATP-independent transporter DctP family solute receptor
MLTRRRFVQGLAVCAAARPGFAADNDGIVLTAADVHVAGYPTVNAVSFINDELAREFPGLISLRLYHSGQLGAEKDTIDLARIGGLALTRVHSSVLNSSIPATRILSMPYVFESTQHMRSAFDGPFGEEILAACEARGLIGLAIYDSGSRNFYNARRPVETPQDLRGLKLRVPQSDIFMESIAALGASPTPLSYSAVFSSLQTHLVDGAENNWPSFHTSRHFEIAPYWSNSEHAFAPDMLVMSKRIADSLPAVQREFLLDAARRSVPSMRAQWDATVEASRKAVIEVGVVVSEIERPAFRRAVQPLVDRYLRDEQIRRLYEALQRV